MDLIAGACASWTAVYLILATYFGVLPTRTDDERLASRSFALGCATFASFTAMMGLHTHAAAHPLEAATWDRRAMFVPMFAGVLFVHSALTFSGVAPSTRGLLVKPAYAVAIAFALANLAGGLYDASTLRSRPLGAGPFAYVDVSFEPRVAFFAFGACAVIVTSMLAFIVIRAYFLGQREILFAAVGASALIVCVSSDVLVALDVTRTLYLTQHGFIVFALGFSHAMLSRGGALATELDRKNSELRRRARRVRKAYDVLRAGQDDLVRREQLAVVGELAAVVSHEVRNPLAIIGNAVTGLKKASTSSDDRKMLLDILDEETARLNTMVGDLLRYARPIHIERQPLDLGALVARACDLVQGHPRVRLERPRADFAALPEVLGDPSMLRQVLDNLVQNACQAMSDGGTLTVEVHVAEEVGAPGVAITFSDTGEGMDTQVRSRARTPFFTTRAEGTGLGLAICERIVTAHGGLMEIRSRKGEGTTVSVFLVAGVTDDVAPPATGASENPESSQRSSWLDGRGDGVPSPPRVPGLLPSVQPLIADPRKPPAPSPSLERTGEHE